MPSRRVKFNLGDRVISKFQGIWYYASIIECRPRGNKNTVSIPLYLYVSLVYISMKKLNFELKAEQILLSAGAKYKVRFDDNITKWTNDVAKIGTYEVGTP